MKKLLLIIALTIFGFGLNAQNVGDVITIANLEFKITSFFPFECEVSDYSGNQDLIIIPSTVEISGTEYSVTSIGSKAFYGCSSLISIEIPNTVTSIGQQAFYGCSSLTSIGIPNSVTSIGDWAFYRCSSLTSVTFGENSQLTSIESSTFYGCSSLTSIEIPNSVTSIEYEAFSGCSDLASVTFGENSQFTTIAYHTFSGCSSLTSIEIPNSVTTIGNFAFEDCLSLASIEIPNTVTSIGCSVFSGCLNLTSMVVEEGNPVYDSRDNSNAIIETATNTLISGYEYTIIPNSVTSIGISAFSGCSSLASIEIPDLVTSIGIDAFDGCESLRVIKCYADNVPETECNQYYCSVFGGCPSDMTIYVPMNSVQEYKAADLWNDYNIVGSCKVSVSANNKDYGTVEGGDLYEVGEKVTVKAIANQYCYFINWTENDNVVSTNAEYTFYAVNPDRNLVANFVKISVPENIEATALSASSVSLSWDAVEDADSYNVYRDGKLLKNVNTNSYLDEGLEANTEYCYEITAVRNETETDKSVEVCATTFDLPITTPENLIATATSTSSIILTWDNVKNAESYNVYRDSEMITNVTNTNYTDKDLEYNTEYCYEVTAVCGDKESDKSEEVCAKTFDLPITTPENLIATATSTSSIILTWDNVKNAESYNVYRDSEMITNVTNTNYTDKDLEYNTEYCYEVTAVCGDKESEKSKMVCAKTLGESLEELSSSSINIYPNPVKDEMFLATEIRVEEIAIYDVYGRQTKVYGLQTTDFVHSVDVADLEAGVYFVNIKTDNGNVVKRFVKK